MADGTADGSGKFGRSEAAAVLLMLGFVGALAWGMSWSVGAIMNPTDDERAEGGRYHAGVVAARLELAMAPGAAPGAADGTLPLGETELVLSTLPRAAPGSVDVVASQMTRVVCEGLAAFVGGGRPIAEANVNGGGFGGSFDASRCVDDRWVPQGRGSRRAGDNLLILRLRQG